MFNSIAKKLVLSNLVQSFTFSEMTLELAEDLPILGPVFLFVVEEPLSLSSPIFEQDVLA